MVLNEQKNLWNLLRRNNPKALGVVLHIELVGELIGSQLLHWGIPGNPKEVMECRGKAVGRMGGQERKKKIGVKVGFCHRESPKMIPNPTKMIPSPSKMIQIPP